MKKKIVPLLIFLGIGIFFIWLSVKDLTPERIKKIQDSATGVLNLKSMIFIFISMACGVIAHYFRALRNILLINQLGYSVRKTTAFYSVMVCYLSNLAIPRSGEVLRCSFLQRYDKVPFQKSLGTVVIDRALDLLIFFALFILIIFLNNGLISELPKIEINENGDILAAWISEKMAAVWAMKYYLLIAFFIGLTAILFILKKTKGKIKKILLEIWQGLISIKNLQHPYLFVIYTIAIWVCYYLSGYFCFYAFDFLKNLGHMMPMAAFVVLVMGSIGFMIAQGGLGAYPFIVAGILFVLYKVNFDDGIAAGWIGWTAQTIMVLVVGFTTLILSSFLKVEDRAVKKETI